MVVAAISSARARAGLAPLVVDLHPNRPDRRGIRLPWGDVVMLPDEPSLAEIESAGGQVVLHDEPHPIGGGYFVASGMVPRQTTYETGLPGHLSFHGEEVQPDELIADERLVAARVRGRGTTVLSACSHAGIVNACLEAQRMVPGAPIDVVLGGFHLAGAAVEDRIDPTVRDLVDLIHPSVVAPGHCTGWRANAALAAAFAPARFAPSVVGSRYVLTAV
jgi:7,8-dihydropterin-6-yl-methyl-4-(beta-D-ribofuranosyl)aminobenzene 5'-phosphate synthase